MRNKRLEIRVVLEKLSEIPNFENDILFKKLVDEYIKNNYTDIDWLFYEPTAEVSLTVLAKLFPNNRASSYFMCPRMCLGEWEHWYYNKFIEDRLRNGEARIRNKIIEEFLAND